MFDHQRGEFLCIDGGNIYFECLGNNNASTVIVLLHGGMQTIESFNYLLKEISDHGFRFIGIDTRGHGRSTLKRHLSYEVVQRDAEHVLKYLNIRECIIIGHSDGGTAAIRIALSGMVKVSKLICIGSRGF